MASILSQISISTSLFSKFLDTIPRSPTTIDITFIFMFHKFLWSLICSKYFSNFLLSFIFSLWFAEIIKSTWWYVLLFLFGFGDPFVSQNPKEFYAFHFLGEILVCAYITCQHGKILVSSTIPSGTHTHIHTPSRGLHTHLPWITHTDTHSRGSHTHT